MTNAKYGAILQYKLLLLLIDFVYLWSLWSIAWNLKASELMMHFILLTVLMTIYAGMYWMSIYSRPLRYWPVHSLILQGILLIAISLIVNTMIIPLSLYLILVIYVVDSLAQAQPGRAALACYLFLFLLSISLILIQFAYWHANSWAYFTPLLFCIGGYCVLFLRQAATNERARCLLQNLEAAHAQLAAYAIEVEELTLVVI